MRYKLFSVQYLGTGGSRILQRGVFPISSNTKDEVSEAVRVANHFIHEIRKEMGNIKIERVLFDEVDITDKCKYKRGI